MRRWGRLLRSGIAVLAALAPAIAGAEVSESAVKAAYVFKLASFVTWPPTALGAASEPFRICVMDRNDIAAPLSQIARGQRVWGHPVTVSAVASGSSVGQCDVLFAGSAHVELAESAPVLTVTDRGSEAPQGVVEFVTEGSHVRFIVHRQQAEARRLQISSKLLTVAAAVVP